MTETNQPSATKPQQTTTITFADSVGKALETTNHLPNCKVGATNPRACVLTEASSIPMKTLLNENSSKAKDEPKITAAKHNSNEYQPMSDPEKQTLSRDNSEDEDRSVEISDKRALMVNGDAKPCQSSPSVVGKALQTSTTVCSPGAEVNSGYGSHEDQLTCGQCNQVIPKEMMIPGKKANSVEDDETNMGRGEHCYTGSCSEECYSYSGSASVCSCMDTCDQGQYYGCELNDLGQYRCNLPACRGMFQSNSIGNHLDQSSKATLVEARLDSNSRSRSKGQSVETIGLEMCQDIPDVLI